MAGYARLGKRTGPGWGRTGIGGKTGPGWGRTEVQGNYGTNGLKPLVVNGYLVGNEKIKSSKGS